MSRDVREQQILDAAAEEFSVRGYRGGSVERVASAVGVSRTMVHAYFASKDGLYLACLRRAGDTLVSEVEAAQVAMTDPAARALDTLRAILRALEPRRHDWGLLYDATAPRDSPIHEVAARYRRRLAALGASGTAHFLTLSGDHDPQDAELLNQIWLDVVGSTVRWWLRHPEETPESVIARAARISTALRRPN